MPSRWTTSKTAASVLFACVLAAGCGVDQPTETESSSAELSGAETGELTEVAPAATSSSEPDQPASTTPAETSSTASTSRPTTSTADTETSTAETSAPETSTTETTSSTTTTTSTTTTSTTTTSTTTTTAAPESSPTALDRIALDLELVATLTRPVGLAPRPGTNDLFVVEQGGRIVRLPNGQGAGADTTLDLRGQLSGGNEQGLLGLVFDAGGNRLYVNFTDAAGNTNIVRYSMNGNTADLGTAEVLLQIEQPRGNHNGGHLAFGPDGFLYIGMGDGGGGGDPFEHGQNPNTLHGSVLRIDVNTNAGYNIPPNNPFVAGAAPEVFVWGIRNAWRFSFDSANGDLWIGDVGQDRFEEVTVLRARNGGGNGANLGWNAFEGDESFRGGTAPEGHVLPIVNYAQTGGRCSVTGGEVVRSTSIPGLSGTYLYGDFCTGETFGIRADGSGSPARLDLPAIDALSSFALDASGEPYVLSRSGGVFRIVAG